MTHEPLAPTRAAPRIASTTRWSRFTVPLLALLLTACGGGGGVDVPGVVVTPPNVTVPVINSQPASVSAAVGGSAAFTVAASGGGLGYLWQRSRDGGLSWGTALADGLTTLTITSVDASMNGDQYRVAVFNILGTAVSSPATLSVVGASGGSGGAGGLQ